MSQNMHFDKDESSQNDFDSKVVLMFKKGSTTSCCPMFVAMMFLTVQIPQEDFLLVCCGGLVG